MSTIVRSVYDALKSQVSTTLGSEWTELKYIFDIEKNDQRDLLKGYAIEPLAASNNPSVLKTYTLDQGFQITLTRTNAREINDNDLIEGILDDLYDEASEIFKAVLDKQLGIPNIVMSVSSPNMDQPEFLAAAAVLRIQVVVKWREQLT